jgi:thioredoxin reductase
MSKPPSVIIIGAGIAGLVTAKTYLQVCRHLDRPVELIVLDEGKDLGGVWSTERHYPGLMVQAPNGYYELSDLTMVDEDHPRDDLISAAREHAYLEAYARQFDVFDKIRFSTKVVRVCRRNAPLPPGWTVETASGEVLECDKLIVASGLYSEDRPIPVPCAAYTGTAIHSRYMSRVHERLCSDPDVGDVVVIGACKSAVETCSVFLAAKKRVHWVIRPSDQGAPLLIFHPDQKPSPLAIALTRFLPMLTPSVWVTGGFWYNFLHSGSWLLGTWLVRGFFGLMSWAIMREIHYGKSQNSLKIQPKRKNLFFYSTYLSLIVEGAPFFDALHEDNPEKLTVYRATPVKCEGREIVVDEENAGERRIPADAVVWSIGWDPGLDFFDPDEAAELGLPVPLDKKGTSHGETQKFSTDPALPTLESYDTKVRKLFPATLNTTPAQPQDPTTTLRHSRWGLYRFIIPAKHFATGDRTLAFSGMISSGQTATTSEVGALWAVSWLEDLFPSPPMPLLKSVGAPRLTVPSPWLADAQGQARARARAQAQLSRRKNEDKANSADTTLSPTDLERLANAEIRFNQAFQERRYGLRGARAPELILEARSYIDLLCHDLGVQVHRKRRLYRDDGGGGGGGRWWSSSSSSKENEKTSTSGNPWGEIKIWVREYFEPYLASDYRGLVMEFLRNRETETPKKVG